MKRPVLLTALLLITGWSPGGRAANLPPASASDAPLSGVPTPADIDAAALKVAETLDGVLRNCPAAYAAVGTPGKRCVGVAGDVETVRAQLGADLGADLYGVWRSRDDQRTVFNWFKMPSGTVYLRIASDEAASGRSLVYLDAPTVPAAALTPQPRPGHQAGPAHETADPTGRQFARCQNDHLSGDLTQRRRQRPAKDGARTRHELH